MENMIRDDDREVDVHKCLGDVSLDGLEFGSGIICLMFWRIDLTQAHLSLLRGVDIS